MNSFNFILNECGGVLARRVAAGVSLTRSDGQVVEREQGSRAAGNSRIFQTSPRSIFQSTTTLYLLIEVLYLLTRSLAASPSIFVEPPHHSFCSLKAQTGYLRNLVVSRILFTGRVRPLSVEDGSPQLSQFYPARRLVALAPKPSTDQNLSSGCSVHQSSSLCNFINPTKS
jgi:hypothetical protein